MGGVTYCCGLQPKAALILISAVDAILSLCLFLLSTLALADLHQVSELIERDISDDSSSDFVGGDYSVQLGINEFTHIHGQVVLVLIGSLISLFLGLGLFVGVRKDWDCPIKAWLINGCVTILLGVISILVLTIVSCHLSYLLLGILILVRLYEMWVVWDFLRMSRFTSYGGMGIGGGPSSTSSGGSGGGGGGGGTGMMSRTGSTERLHNV